MKRISVLGSTGSIGVSTLDVIRAHRDQFVVTALTAGRNINLMKQQIEQFQPRLAAVVDEAHASKLRRLLGPATTTDILYGPDGYRETVASADVDMVVSAIAGAAGLIPTLNAIEAGKDIALANKETLVMAGDLVLRKAAEMGVKVIPVDSEHSAIFQCLQGHRKQDVRRIILTASGGPFLHASEEERSRVTPAQALRHPTWSMGKKITIDSATMMNKGLEVIEAGWLFGLPGRAIDVLIHPQSIVHSLVEYRDGSVIAQMGMPDMKIPIAYALSYPNRLVREENTLDLRKVGNLAFLDCDPIRFTALRLAYAAAKTGGTMPAVLNGANEMAVMAFIEEKIRFDRIVSVVDEVLSRHRVQANPCIDAILEADRWARQEAGKIIEGIKN
ncbi:MAG: 1-deoxy-D-xylulose-5-phosphate reductoisomerase [Deltaproteobacteria bacterium]|nr:1-deoxy-D-xylulose-5-phosphate reductoisomerase [Deltaproteobacteria bacterium]